MRLRTQLTIAGTAGTAGTVGAFIGLSGCASRGDVRAEYDAARDSFESARETYDADMAHAQMWNEHTLGIPAAGWVGIMIAGVVVLGVLLIVAGYAFYRAQGLARADRHALAMEREKTVQEAARRGACPGCGLNVPGVLEQIREREKA